MTPTTLQTWMLEREARALLTRLRRVQPFALQETMVPAAALSPAAQDGIDRYLIAGRRDLEQAVVRYVRWLRGVGSGCDPVEQQRRLTILRVRFNLALSQLDLFSDAVTQRSEHSVGVWLAGLDVAAEDALDVAGAHLISPPIVCYVHRGLGGAIRRAHTRLPGGGRNPVAMIRIPRERMIGFGISSTLFHETGHQAAALLGLVESLRLEILRHPTEPGRSERPWQLFARWTSEIVADVWSIGRVGVASTMGLISLVSLPRPFVFKIGIDDPHPFGWIRVKLSCAFGAALYPNPQWQQLASVWESFYPVRDLPVEQRRLIGSLQAAIPEFVRLVLGHRPATLRGSTLGEVVHSGDRHPAQLLQLFRQHGREPTALFRVAPTVAFAVVGQARAAGLLGPETEDVLLDKLITHWALQSTLGGNARLAAVQQLPRWATTPIPAAPAARIPTFRPIVRGA
jgi:hypothetical protein